MKNKSLRIIIGLIPIIVGVVFVVASIRTMIDGKNFIMWLSPGLFGVLLIFVGVEIMSGAKLQDIFRDYL